MDTTIRISVLLTLVGICQGQVLARGGCPTVATQDNLDLKQYAGRWYEMQRFFAIFQPFIHCSTAEYELLPSNMVIVNNTGFSKLSGAIDMIIGQAMVIDEKSPAKLGVKFFDDQPYGNYWVLSTDYTSYSVVWSCTEVYMGLLGKLNAQLAWILTRKPEGIPDSKRDDLIKMMNDQGIKTDAFLRITQTSCPGR